MLIIDDEAAIRESLQTLLEMEGYAVESAATADEGLARIGERPFDLVLLDLALPDRNGIDLLAELRAHDPAALRHHDHRLRHGGKCGEGHAGGRHQLRPEALGQRKAAG